MISKHKLSSGKMSFGTIEIQFLNVIKIIHVYLYFYTILCEYSPVYGKKKQPLNHKTTMNKQIKI